jgi:hypothetical protein
MVVLGTSTQKQYPISNQTRSRPELDDRFEIFWVATDNWVATRSKILDCFHQAVYQRFPTGAPHGGLRCSAETFE